MLLNKEEIRALREACQNINVYHDNGVANDTSYCCVVAVSDSMREKEANKKLGEIRDILQKIIDFNA